MKVVIAGGGVAGLGIGLRLRQFGCDVTVVERDAAARGATWAAAGMLSPGMEVSALGDEQIALGREGRERWPQYARDLEAASGCGLRLRETGALIVAHNDGAAFSLADEVAHMGGAGVWLDAAAARNEEPSLGEHIAGAMLVPGDADVDNRALGRALAVAFTRAGGELREHCLAQALLTDSGRASGLMTSQGAVAADAVLIAMGAWSGKLAGVPDGVLPLMRPAKGQLVSLAPPQGAHIPKRVIGDHNVYLVPRGNRLMIGATVEDAGFDLGTSDSARAELVSGAARIIPAAADWPVAETWTGLRPRSADDAPVLGETVLPALFVASGQFRNGILFAPAIAEAMACLIAGKPAPFAIDAFDPRRFGNITGP